MRKLFSITLSIILLTSLDLVAQPTAGLVAHWSFNGNANDISGHGHHGNIHNVTSVPGKLGYPNTGYLFNSANSYISIPYDSGLNMNNAISLCAIIKPTAIYTNTCQGNFILSRGLQGSSGGYLLSFFDNVYNDCSVADTNGYVFTGQAGPTILNSSLWPNATRVHTNAWYCVVLTYDGTNCKIYVDGALTLTLPGWASTIGSSTDSISIGKYLWAGASYPYNFTGIMDDVAIYNRALTDTEAMSYCNFAALGDTSHPDTTTSVGRTDPDNKIVLYPNPADDKLVIDADIILPEAVAIRINNMAGQEVVKTMAPAGKKLHKELNIKNLPAGTYVAIMKVDGENLVIKFNISR